MSSKIEIFDKNQAKISMHIPADTFEEGMNYSYNKNKSKLRMPGFRNGKVPRALAEKHFGAEVFLEDAIDYCFPKAYEAVIEELNVEPVSRPEMEAPEYNKETGVIIPFTVWLKPEVTLGEYKGLVYTDKAVTVTDEEIDIFIDGERQKNSRVISVSDRPVAEGDTVTINFEGFIDDVPFDGGTADNYQLKIGSKTFIDTFEEQLIGKNTDDFVEVFVTFPADYGKEELQGKAAKFNVKINEISSVELPELDDDFAQDISEFDTFDEYKASVRDKLISQKEEQKERDVEEQLIKMAVENAQCDIPEVMFEDQVGQLMSEFSNRLSEQGISLEMFLKYSGKTFNEFKEGYRPAAERNVWGRLVLEAIADAEGMSPSQEAVDGEISRMASAYGIDEENIRKAMGPSNMKGLKTDLKTQMALDFIKENAVKAE